MTDATRQGHAPPPEDWKPIDRLISIMATLRSPTGCPWDLKQTLATLKEHLVEESHEVLDAIDSGDRSKLKEELGDLLLQVVFQAQLCSEEGAFTFDDVASAISEKLIRRHPHVFGDLQVSDADEVLKNWEAIKKSEKKEGPRATLEGVPKSLPALSKAHLVQKRAARVGFDWENIQGAIDKVAEEVEEVKDAVARDDEKDIGEELGDLMFASVNVCRFSGHNPEELLQKTIAKFTRRFEFVEQAVHAQGKTMSDCPLEELENFWQQAKREER
ncbi:MAG: nucleoside triphosphate pyrophosphohydrolase [Kiritimatiellia bacterium]